MNTLHQKRSRRKSEGLPLPGWLARDLRLLSDARNALLKRRPYFDATDGSRAQPFSKRYSQDLTVDWAYRRRVIVREPIRRVNQGPRDADRRIRGFLLNTKLPHKRLVAAMRENEALISAIQSAGVLTLLRPRALSFADSFAPPPGSDEVVIFINCEATHFSTLTAALWPVLLDTFGVGADIRSDGDCVIQFRRRDRQSTRVMFHGRSRKGKTLPALTYASFVENPLAQAVLAGASRLVTMRKRAGKPEWWHLPGMFCAEWIESEEPFVVAVITDDGDRVEWVAAQYAVKGEAN